MNFENTFSYNVDQFTLISHVLSLGFAVMAAGLVYFLVTRGSLAPRYQFSSVLSAVVMVSAFFELFLLYQRWVGAFRWDGTAFVQSDTLFSNGYRYVNWSIDVPVLLIQLLVVMGVTGRRFHLSWVAFVVGGLAMIYTGYAGQFYEIERSAPYWIWGLVSTAFFLLLLVLVARTVYGNLGRLPASARPLARGVWWLLLGSWLLYPGAYLMPAYWDSADGVVARQITYTVADITSKVVYGVLLGIIARRVSAAEGYAPAVADEVALPRGGITDATVRSDRGGRSGGRGAAGRGR
ncbi:bacteriorhodopsin [Micromonospora mirobrigensis]|uniref:Bacteriorhodopsin n=1 Tax=Micromonospora mirobrigensis TaxID=262898 RepID=A0A1C4Y296_9ACTN|nr:bacteriorhodopsin [Micromonospora mirobrigensis]SCF14833.1 Bacteriorhodopsin [Micromonospora mirobrigensis]